MKKLLLLVVSLLLISCTTESTKQSDCNCGTITKVVYHEQYNISTMNVKNNCTGNTKEIEVTGHYYLNQEYCE